MKVAVALVLFALAAVFAALCFVLRTRPAGSCAICDLSVPNGITLAGLEMLGWRWRRPRNPPPEMPDGTLEPLCPNCAPFDPSAGTLG